MERSAFHDIAILESRNVTYHSSDLMLDPADCLISCLSSNMPTAEKTIFIIFMKPFDILKFSLKVFNVKNCRNITETTYDGCSGIFKSCRFRWQVNVLQVLLKGSGWKPWICSVNCGEIIKPGMFSET